MDANWIPLPRSMIRFTPCPRREREQTIFTPRIRRNEHSSYPLGDKSMRSNFALWCDSDAIKIRQTAFANGRSACLHKPNSAK